MDILAQLVSSRWQEMITFLLVFARASGLIVSAPFWGSRVVPVLVRGWVAMLLAVATYPLVGVISIAGGLTIFSLLMALGGEILFGLVLGWMGQLLFAAMRLAGQEMEIKSGLGLLQLVDPNEGGQSGIFGAFLELAAGLVFFSLNGHHLLIQALSSSYKVFPLAGEKFTARLLDGLIFSTGEIFVIAIRVSAPVLIGLLLSDIALGIISRAIPQMNVFIVAQPLQFGLVLLILMLSLPTLVWFFVRQLPSFVGVPGLG